MAGSQRETPSPRRTILRSGCARWSGARFSMPTISDNGSTASSQRTPATLPARNTGLGSSRSPLGRTACIFTAAKCPATTRSWSTTQSTTSRWEPEAANSEPYPNKGTRCLGATRACARRFKSWARTLAGGKSFGGRITTPAKTD
jgi:hypothetical protein